MKNKRKWLTATILAVLMIALVYGYYVLDSQVGINDNSKTKTIEAVKTKAKSAGQYDFSAYVVNKNDCYCPPEAQCEVCYKSITVSDDQSTVQNPTSEDDLIIYTDDIDDFAVGSKHQFTIHVSDPAKVNDFSRANGIGLVSYK